MNIFRITNHSYQLKWKIKEKLKLSLFSHIRLTNYLDSSQWISISHRFFSFPLSNDDVSHFHYKTVDVFFLSFSISRHTFSVCIFTSHHLTLGLIFLPKNLFLKKRGIFFSVSIRLIEFGDMTLFHEFDDDGSHSLFSAKPPPL